MDNTRRGFLGLFGAAVAVAALPQVSTPAAAYADRLEEMKAWGRPWYQLQASNDGTNWVTVDVGVMPSGHETIRVELPEAVEATYFRLTYQHPEDTVEPAPEDYQAWQEDGTYTVTSWSTADKPVDWSSLDRHEPRFIQKQFTTVQRITAVQIQAAAGHDIASVEFIRPVGVLEKVAGFLRALNPFA